MMLNDRSKKLIPFLIVSILLILMGYGCEAPSQPTTGSTEPAAAGQYTKCTYTEGLEDSGYKDAVVYYPCETGDGPFPASTLTGGFTNTKEEMDWAGSHLVTHGYIIIAMTPNNKMGNNPQWRSAHNAGIAMLKSENGRSQSPIAGMVNTNALQIMGFSKGGGGTLLAAHDQGAAIKSAQALAPYMDTSYNISKIKAATIIYTGSDDVVAPPQPVEGMFEALTSSVERTLAYFDEMPHKGWMLDGSAEQHEKALTYMTSWMKVYLSGDSSFDGYIDGSQSWFYRFEHYDSGEGPGGTGRANPYDSYRQ